MNVVEHAFGDVNTCRGGEKPPGTGFIPDALPEVRRPDMAGNSQTGVSTQNALSGTNSGSDPTKKKPQEILHWYALRVTYGREKKAYDYLLSKNIEAFYPTITTVKVIGGKRKSVEESRLPNILREFGIRKSL